MQLSFMSYNIQHGLDYLRWQREEEYRRQDMGDLPLMAQAIRRCKADIVGINEVRGRGEIPQYTAQAEELAAMLGYHAYFAPAIYFEGRGPYGNALLSKYPIIRAERILIPDPPVQDEDTYYETRCLLKAQLAVAGGITVYVCHFGLAMAEARNAVKTLTAELDRQSGPCVFMGDLNLTPQSDILAPIYSRLQDTAAAFSRPQLSFPSDRPDRKIDYIFTSRDIKVLSAEIPEVIAADHRPHTALLEIGG
ncbi:MAG: hypothetical protein HFG27_13360 [Provencibacterium sp.]|jgi:endonuclease/exonuclease/phosphatase family metal-dependent hydrolase|nr:hypothetical protein [Provencibacterium sp.]